MVAGRPDWRFRPVANCFPFAVVRGHRPEERPGGEDSHVVRDQQRGASAHRRRMPAVVPHRLPGAPRRALFERHQPHHYHVRGDRHCRQLVHARQAVQADLGLPSSEGHAHRVHHEERGHRFPVPGHRAGRQRGGVRRGASVLPQKGPVENRRRRGDNVSDEGTFLGGIETRREFPRFETKTIFAKKKKPQITYGKIKKPRLNTIFKFITVVLSKRQ